MSSRRNRVASFLLAVALIAGMVSGRSTSGGEAPSSRPAARTLDIIRYTPPTGWDVKEAASNAVTLSAPETDAARAVTLLIVVNPAGPTEPFDFGAYFDAAVARIVRHRSVAMKSDRVAGKTTDSPPHDTLSQTVYADDASGLRTFLLVTQVHADSKVVMFVYTAPSAGLFLKYREALSTCLSSVDVVTKSPAAPFVDPARSAVGAQRASELER